MDAVFAMTQHGAWLLATTRLLDRPTTVRTTSLRVSIYIYISEDQTDGTRIAYKYPRNYSYFIRSVISIPS